MTLSVLIPIYNYDASVLVTSLLHLAEAEGIDAEIIVADDASSTLTEWLQNIEAEENVRVLRTDMNIGRARNRNRMAEAARGEWLLFTDCDAQVERDFSFRRYLQASSSAIVVSGGLRHPNQNPDPDATLRYAYEKQADRHRSAEERSRQPYAQFTPFNLFIQRELFLSIRFDESCREYGYEDVLFSVELKKRDIPILHIDNPLVHIGLEPNDVFLEKSETALRTLHSQRLRMDGLARIENIAKRLRSFHLAGLTRSFFHLFQNTMKQNLLGNHPNLTIFALYKLGYYLSLEE